MICRPCRSTSHGECPGGTWCDCAHEPGLPGGDCQATLAREEISLRVALAVPRPRARTRRAA
jgi:hypothetical protein